MLIDVFLAVPLYASIPTTVVALALWIFFGRLAHRLALRGAVRRDRGPRPWARVPHSGVVLFAWLS